MKKYFARSSFSSAVIVAVVAAVLAGCGKPAPPVSAAVASTSALPPFKTTASVQELMEAIVDPSADGVWDSVGATISKGGVENHQPRTDDEWKKVRLHAVALIEGTNLLMMEGRRLVPEGGRIADDGADGVLKTEDAEQRLKTERAAFVQFALALNEVGVKMLRAIDAKQPEAMIEVGEQMDEVCESCHMRFWYPNQAVWTISQSTKKESVAP